MNIKNNTLVLSNGVQIPQFGLGVFRIHDGTNVVDAVSHALKHGYRSIDTASLYGNETGVGRAIHSSGLSRDDVFITTKVWNTQQGFKSTMHAFEESLKRMALEYIDLYLVHWPIKKHVLETWRALETLYKEGRVRAIGVSNFYAHHLEMLFQHCSVMPMVNQVELHPLLQLHELQAYCNEKNILLEAWAPIMRGKVRRIVLLQKLGKKYNKSPIQIALRWAIQRGIIVIPKSENPDRIVSNADIYDFSLSEEEMSAIHALDRGKRIGPHPDNFFLS